MPKGAIVSDRLREFDKSYIVKDRERIAYIIVNGQEGHVKNKLTQKELAVSPEEFVESNGILTINSQYYIQNLINPALNRIFQAVFEVDVNAWLESMPKSQMNQSKSNGLRTPSNDSRRRCSRLKSKGKDSKSLALAQNQSMTINQFYQLDQCFACGRNGLQTKRKDQISSMLCDLCSTKNKREAFAILYLKLQQKQN